MNRQFSSRMVYGIPVPPELFEPPKFGDLRQINAAKRFSEQVQERLENDLYEVEVRYETSSTVKLFAKDDDEARELALEEADFRSSFTEDSWINSICKLPNPYRPRPLPPEVQPRLFDEATVL